MIPFRKQWILPLHLQMILMMLQVQRLREARRIPWLRMLRRPRQMDGVPPTRPQRLAPRFGPGGERML
eukprot:symbB.v1.2.005499.t1/scaffold310.1/size231343/4